MDVVENTRGSEPLMCGIIATFGISKKRAEKGIKTLYHRGPDNQGLFFDESSGLCLGHTRLSIQDVSEAAHQPMFSECGRYCLTYNGEIYNFPQLKADLQGKGYRFKTESDTEVLLNLYKAFGEGVLEKIKGIFAFAIWDSQREILFVARDSFGVKPIYFYEGEGTFVLASELKALVELAPVPDELDIKSVHRYLTLAWSPGGGTPLEAIRKLGPGQGMRVVAGKVKKIWSWYQLPVFKHGPRSQDVRSACEGVTDHLREAVRHQLISDVPVGAFLSGGLDSSAIVSMAREVSSRIDCFTISIPGGPDQGSHNDLPYARMAAKHLDVPLHVIEVDSSTFARDLVKMVYMLDEPQADPAALNVLYISQLARRNGIKVLLSGVGGDDLFSGYRRHAAIQMEPWWTWVPQGIRKLAPDVVEGLDSRVSSIRRLKRFLTNAVHDPEVRMAGYLCQIAEGDAVKLFRAGLRNELLGDTAVRPIVEFIREIPSSRSRLQKMLAVDQRFFLSDHNLNYTDKMAMAAGVEVRVPFLDDALVNFAGEIPDNLKFRRSTSKWILREAMKPYLPKQILRRPKTGFGLPIRRWVRYELREMISTYLSSECIRSRGIFDSVAIQDLVRKNDAGIVDGAYTLFALLCFEIWCQLFIDKKAEYKFLYEGLK